MADIAREMEDFKAANRTFGGEWKLEMKGNSSSNQASAWCSTPNPPPRPLRLSTASTYNKASKKYSNKNHNYSSRVGNAEWKRQRRLVKYNSYAVEDKLKSSVINGFRWMKNKYCQFVRGY